MMPVIKVKSEEVKIKVPITTLRIEPTTQTKTVEPTIEEQTITPDEGVFALSSVTVNPVTSEIDENIKAENIKEGVSILGVEGNVVIPDTNIEITNANYLFYGGARTEYVKQILSLCKNVKSTNYMFYMCGLSELDLSNFDTSELEDATHMFSNNLTVRKYDLTGWDTSKVKKMTRMFYSNTQITDLVMLDASSVENIYEGFISCINLINFGGLKDLGKAYLTTRSENYSNYKLDLSGSIKLTEQSLINVLNGLYDIASIGVKTQQCILGSTNLEKLTSEEGQQALTNATAKGWTVS